MTVTISNTQIVKEILCDILEIEPEELAEEGLFEEDYDADSLRAVEILSALEKEFGIKIPQDELPKMTNFKNVKSVISSYGWEA